MTEMQKVKLRQAQIPDMTDMQKVKLRQAQIPDMTDMQKVSLRQAQIPQSGNACPGCGVSSESQLVHPGRQILL